MQLRNNAGFTLVELIIILAVLGLFSTLVSSCLSCTDDEDYALTTAITENNKATGKDNAKKKLQTIPSKFQVSDYKSQNGKKKLTITGASVMLTAKGTSTSLSAFGDDASLEELTEGLLKVNLKKEGHYYCEGSIEVTANSVIVNLSGSYNFVDCNPYNGKWTAGSKKSNSRKSKKESTTPTKKEIKSSDMR